MLINLLLIAVVYLIGSLSSAIIVCKLWGLPDPRSKGSNNPGATNVLRIGGKLPAIITLLGDGCKGFLPTFIVTLLDFPSWVIGSVMLAALVGHIFPVFFGFKGGKISFREFMQQALYAPGLGYYNAGAIKFGAQGDFITAPEIGSLFAKCLTAQCAEILELLPNKNILEFGAGSGRLACDILQQLTMLNINIDNYYILELSADLKQRQQDLIFTTLPNLKHKVQWLDRLPSQLDAIMIANEVLDAMPIAKFHYENNMLQEYFVTLLNDDFCFTLAAPSPNLSQLFADYKITEYISQPYTSEINPLLPHWIKSISNSLKSGVIILCDYGFPRAEYYHPQRDTGTLMCHYQYRCHDNPFLNLGLQDITAHVDFTAVAEAADACGLELAGYTNQASFLLNCDISNYLIAPTPQLNRELQTLTSPAEMGELFKVIALTKGIDPELLGFQEFDKTHTL